MEQPQQPVRRAPRRRLPRETASFSRWRLAELARRRMPFSKAKAMAVGDVNDLGALGVVKLRVGDRVLMTAEPGEADGVRSARVKRRV